MGQLVVTICHQVGGISVSAEQLQGMPQIIIYIPSRGTRGAVTLLWLNCCVLTVFPLFLYSLDSLIINCLSLLFGTWGRPRKLRVFYKQEVGDMEELLYPEGPAGSCLVSLILDKCPIDQTSSQWWLSKNPPYISGQLDFPKILKQIHFIRMINYQERSETLVCAKIFDLTTSSWTKICNT